MSQPIDRPELTADAVRVLHSGREFRFVHDDAGDHIYSTLRTSRSFYEITLLDELARLVPRGAVAIDVGANIGNHAVYFAGVMGCKVIAFEPNTRAASLLKLNAELNALTPDIEIRECAAGAHRRRARMTDGEPHNLGTAGISAVESGDIDVMPLDELAIDGEIGLLKIDVEGMEADVLAGARELLRRHKPVLAIEARQPEEYLRIVREIAPLGYMPVGSFNYTPTHIFRTKTESETADTYTTALSHRLSLQYIDTMARTASVDRRFVNIQGQLSQQTENDRAASAKIDAIESKQTDLSDTLAQTNKAFASLDERSTKALATLQDEIRSTGGQLAALAAAITRVGAEIKALRSDNETNTAKADARFGELRALAATLEDSHTAIRQDITASLSAVLNQVSELDTRFRSERSSVATAAERAERQIRALEENSTARAIEQGAALQHLREAVDSNRGQIEQRIDGIETALYRTLSEHHRAIASLQGATDGRLAEVAARLESVLLDLPSIGRELEGVGARIGELETRLNNTPQPDLSNLEENTFRTVARVADIEQSLDGLRQGFNVQSDQALEIQLLANLDINARFAALEHRLQTAQQRLIEDHVSKALGKGFAELASRLTDAMGIAIADHRVADEIASAADASDLGQALEILQIPTQDVDPTSSVTAPVATQPGAAGPQSTEKVWHVKGYVSKPRVASTPPCEAASEILATIDYSEGWTGKGWGQGASQLETGARVTAPASCPRLGFVGPTIPLEYGGLLEVTVEIDDAPASGARPLLQIQSTDGVGIGHDFELNQGATTVRAFAPHSTKVIKFYVVMLDAPAGASFTMGRLVVRRIDTDDHCRRIRAKVGEPVLASLASIPSRESMLRDCVNSLLAQCDKVRVFLNSYPHVPGFLEHPRIEIRRSQDWDDRGDAGKFFWIDRDNEVPGYRVIADDDLIFPPDFVEVLAGKVAATGKRAIFATHGVLLRQPFARYYDRSARAATFHFSNALSVDRGIHISATGAMCFHSSTIDMGWGDFKYSNSADTWVTLYTQNNKIAAFTPARPRNWLRENEHAVPSDTIYRHSLNRTKSRFDSSHIQDAVLRHAWPLTVNTLSRPKVAVAVHLNHPSDLASSVGPWLKKASAIADRAEPVFVLSFYGGNDSLKAAIDQQPIPYETHLIDCSHARADPLAKVLALHVRLGFDATLLGAEKVQPVAHPQDNDAEDSVVLSTEPPISLGPAQITAWQRPHADRPCAIAVSGGEKGNDGLACLLGKGCRLRSSHQNNSAADDAFHLAGHNLRERVENAMAEGRRSAARPRHARPPTQIRTVNDLFQRVVVLNLDRRPERWERVSAELAREGIKTERFSAVDGLNPAIAKEYEDYSRRPPHTVGPDLPEIRFATDLYMNYPSQMARVAHLEASTGRKAIASAGAWGYLRSYEAILERSLTEQDETLLVFDDDIVLHREFRARFEQAVSQLPPNWLIIQLGTLQYNWTHPWCQWQSPMLYRTNGAAIGSHAVGMRFEILPFLLDHTRRMDLPYDIGPLSAATRAFADRCFVIHPNLAIQSLDDSDIGTSDFQKTRSREEIAAVYRWNLSDYRSQENADPS